MSDRFASVRQYQPALALRGGARCGILVALLCGLCNCSDSEGTKPDAQTSNDAGHASGMAGSSSGTSGAAGAGLGGSSGSAGMSASGADDAEPHWSGIFQNVFTTCRLDSCHGGGLIGVDFSNQDAAWNSLVNQPAAADSACAMLGKKRVVPNEPDESLLYLKLNIDSPCGSQMPPGGQLRQAARDRIRAWIEMGAKND